MITGIFLIVCGVLLLVYPPLLSIIVAVFLILLGVVVLMVARDYRQYNGERRAHVIEYIFRY